MYLLGNAFFRRATGGRWSVAHLVGVVVVLAVFLLRDALTPLALNWVSNGVLLAVIVGDVLLDRRRRTATARTLRVRAVLRAETVGFEPTEGLRLHDLSRVAH